MSTNQQDESNKTKLDFLNQEFIKNPFPVYKDIRKKDPIFRFLMPNGQHAWIITSFKDASLVINDSRFVTNYPVNNEVEESNLPPHKAILSRNLLSVNPSDHRRLRRLVQKAFTPRMVEKLRERIEEITVDLLDRVQQKGEMKLIEDFAFPLPIKVICEMLGVPVKDQYKFQEWSNSLMESVNNPIFSQKGEEATIAFVEYLQDLIEQRRRYQQDDLISDLIKVEEEGDVLSEHELYALVFVLIIAGHETTVNLIGNGVLALLEFPEQKEKLISNPDLIHSAIEEILRYNGPAEVSNVRWAIEDVSFGEKIIRKGEMVLIALSSANRDPSEFINPDMFDITREVNNHLAFGKGVHFCLGAPLARLEGEIAIRELLQRMPDLRLKDTGDSLEWRQGMIIRGVKEIPIIF
ncbi:cytochrome P450 [Metabacillus litoralis]|uniref:cytochrome P450 family protein n=1 Tax=Metabacillus litoralis TaxID=152268 RepID=UPI00203E9443|nr:cytochrome P450 [Metabacillus litoralis]MCM3160787.1 cytochrome P450 [Metabacillus litoralis]